MCGVQGIKLPLKTCPALMHGNAIDTMARCGQADMEERRGVLEEGSAFTLEALQHQASSLLMWHSCIHVNGPHSCCALLSLLPLCKQAWC